MEEMEYKGFAITIEEANPELREIPGFDYPGWVIDITSGWKNEAEKEAISSRSDGYCGAGIHFDNLHTQDDSRWGEPRTKEDLIKQVKEAIDLRGELNDSKEADVQDQNT